MPFSIKIAILSDTRYLAPLRRFLSAYAKIVGRKRFPRDALKFCTTALIEAVDNAIFHAHFKKKDKWIEIYLTVKNNSIIMKIADCGKGLNHMEIKNPCLTATHGRGLYVMKRLMDSVESRFSGKRHEMILTYKL